MPATVELGVSLTSDLPHVGQYFGLWAMHEPVFWTLYSHVRTMDIGAHMREVRAAAEPAKPGYLVDDGIAIIDIEGSLTKYGSSLGSQVGTVAMRKSLREARNDPAVKAVIQRIDSPGGTVAGTDDLAKEVARTNAVKPVTSFIEDLGASAAYYVAAMAGRVVSNASATVGSIGTYDVVYDKSRAFENEGVVAHVIRSGQFKGAGAAGTKITDAQLEEWQRQVDALNALFVNMVARGRGISVERVQALANGRVWVGIEAAALGLTDGVATWDEMLAGVRRDIASARRPRAVASVGAAMMSENENASIVATTSEPKPATLVELKKALPNADSAFFVECIELEATIDDAKDLWIDHLQKAQAEMKRSIETVKAQNAAIGVEALGTVSKPGKAVDSADDPIAAWNEAVNEQIAAGKKRPQAVKAVVRAQPELREAYVAAWNARYK